MHRPTTRRAVRDGATATSRRTPRPLTAGPETAAALAALGAEIAACGVCPRLVAWREASAANPPPRFRGETYHARPVPGFGDPDARILLLGLAPAKDGGNRTGRVFTGDRSGDFLFAALHRVRLANQPTSKHSADGLQLRGAYVAAAVRCAPPGNKPLPDERDRCAPFLHRELALLAELRVIVALGAFAWEAALRAVEATRDVTRDVTRGATRGALAPALAPALPRPLPHFGHGAEAAVGPYTLLGAYHPSQQNTFTGRLTQEMLDTVLRRARDAASPARADDASPPRAEPARSSEPGEADTEEVAEHPVAGGRGDPDARSGPWPPGP